MFKRLPLGVGRWALGVDPADPPYNPARYTYMKRSLLAALVLLSASGGISGQSSTAARPNDPPDREYRLESSMLGYRGIGGEIDGIRNPTLWAKTGETVRITIVNGELMVHDIALEKGEVKSTQILDKGATANITFKATTSDTYFCSLPGHRVAGMLFDLCVAGRLEEARRLYRVMISAFIRKSGPRMPATVYWFLSGPLPCATPFRVMVVPTTLGSPPNTRCQKP